MTKQVSLGVVGLGTIAQTQHLPNIAELGDRFRITAVSDLSAKLTSATVDRLPGAVTASQTWRDVCADPDVEAVLFLTTGAHEVMAEEALLAGKHVFAEKPLCLTVDAARRLNALARERGLVLEVGYMKMHERSLDDVRQSMERIGALRMVRHTVYHPETDLQLDDIDILRFDDVDEDALTAAVRFEEGRTVEALGEIPPEWGRLYRDVLQGSLVHSVSFIRGIMGGLPAITDASLWPSDGWSAPGVEPPNLAVGGMANGGTRVELNWLWLPSYPTYRETVEVHGTEGSLVLELPPPYEQQREAELTVRTGGGVDRSGGGNESAFLRELVAFHAAIIRGEVLDDALGVAADTAWLESLVGALAADAGVHVGGEAKVGS